VPVPSRLAGRKWHAVKARFRGRLTRIARAACVPPGGTEVAHDAGDGPGCHVRPANRRGNPAHPSMPPFRRRPRYPLAPERSATTIKPRGTS
jgi:hypothetical protein